MNRATTLWILMLWGVGSCSRDFSAPPPVPPTPQISSIEPAEGFMGDLVTIKGANFDPQPENNLIFFGTESAEVKDVLKTGCGDDVQNPGCLSVVVPELEVGDQVYVKVSTPKGQATSEIQFSYRGPGHPLEQQLGRTIPIQWNPVAVAPLYFDSSVTTKDKFDSAIVNSTGRNISLMNTNSGIHLDLGTFITPISTGMTQIKEGDQIKYHLYTSLIDMDAASANLNTSLSLFEFTLGSDKTPSSVIKKNIIEFRSPDGQILDTFRPGRIWTFCKTTDPTNPNVCETTKTVISDFVSPKLLTNILIETLEGEPEKAIAKGEPITLGDNCPMASFSESITGLAFQPDPIEPGNDRFLVLLRANPGIWSLPQKAPECPPVNLLETILLECADFDKEGCPGTLESLHLVHAAKEIQDDLLYAVDTSSNRLLEYSFKDDQGGYFPDKLFLKRRSQLWTTPQAMTSATFTTNDANGVMVTSVYLYLAIEGGVIVYLIKDFPSEVPQPAPVGPIPDIPVVAYMPLSACFQGSQAITTIHEKIEDQGSIRYADKVLVADSCNDRVFVAPVSHEPNQNYPINLGISFPQLATSQFEDLLYLGDPLSNVVRIINQDSGIQTDQFSIFSESDFGTRGVFCLNVDQKDILLFPLPAPRELDTDKNVYDRLAVRRFNSLEEMQNATLEQYTIGSQVQVAPEAMTNDLIALVDNEKFHEVLPALHTKFLYLVRYGLTDPDLEKREYNIWAVQVSPGADLKNILEGLSREEDAPTTQDPGKFRRRIDPRVTLVRLSQDERILAGLRPRDQEQTKSDPALIFYGIRFEKDQLTPNLPPRPVGFEEPIDTNISSVFSDLVTDMAVRVSENELRVYLAMPALGRIKVLKYSLPIIAGDEPAEDSVETTGAPFKLFLSPDGRRLYATHRGTGLVSILDVDCNSEAMCETVLRNVPVEQMPNEVRFHPTGKAAFVSHLNNNVISVIE